LIKEIEKAPGKQIIWRGGQKKDRVITMPWCEFSSTFRSLMHELYESGYVLRDFDWPNWQDEAVKYVDGTKKIDSTDFDICCRLITTHLRKERFCEGHLLGMLKCGHFIALLKRVILLAKGTHTNK